VVWQTPLILGLTALHKDKVVSSVESAVLRVELRIGFGSIAGYAEANVSLIPSGPRRVICSAMRMAFAKASEAAGTISWTSPMRSASWATEPHGRNVHNQQSPAAFARCRRQNPAAHSQTIPKNNSKTRRFTGDGAVP
jgi:hypothetical protein